MWWEEKGQKYFLYSYLVRTVCVPVTRVLLWAISILDEFSALWYVVLHKPFCVSDVISDVTHNNYWFYWSALTDVLPWISTETKTLPVIWTHHFLSMYFVLCGADFSVLSMTLLNKKPRHFFSRKGLCHGDSFLIQCAFSSRIQTAVSAADTRLNDGCDVPWSSTQN